MPEGDRLHLLRLCIAGVAHGRDEASCDILRPLVRHQDGSIATLVADTVGAYKTEPRFVPKLLVDALESDRHAVVEAALRFVLGSQDDVRREAVLKALHTVFEGRDEPLKFQACLPLMRDFHDAAAWAYVIEQTQTADGNRIRTALNWIGDTKNNGHPADAQLLKTFDRFLAATLADQRRVATQALGAFSGKAVVRRLIALLADSDQTVARQAEESLLAQPDKRLVQQLLKEAAAKSPAAFIRTRADALLTKTGQP
jgi:hypothetical protein